jgi:hypothetical protein
MRPVEAIAGEQAHPAPIKMRMHAVAVELISCSQSDPADGSQQVASVAAESTRVKELASASLPVAPLDLANLFDYQAPDLLHTSAVHRRVHR